MHYKVTPKVREPRLKIVGELPGMRKEAVVLVKDAIGHNPTSLCAGERNALLTVQALTDMLGTEM
jgi:hypothetical protein